MKPYTICHMIASVDGRIDCDMTEQIEGGNEYYEAFEALGCPSMMMGRVTMQMHYALAEPFVAADTTPVGREAYHIARKADGYCIGVADVLGLEDLASDVGAVHLQAQFVLLNVPFGFLLQFVECLFAVSGLMAACLRCGAHPLQFGAVQVVGTRYFCPGIVYAFLAFLQIVG